MAVKELYFLILKGYKPHEIGFSQFIFFSSYDFWIEHNAIPFSSKKAYVINQLNGDLTESKTPNKINPKKLGLVIDEFEIEINEIPKHDGGQVIITG